MKTKGFLSFFLLLCTLFCTQSIAARPINDKAMKKKAAICAERDRLKIRFPQKSLTELRQLADRALHGPTEEQARQEEEAKQKISRFSDLDLSNTSSAELDAKNIKHTEKALKACLWWLRKAPASSERERRFIARIHADAAFNSLILKDFESAVDHATEVFAIASQQKVAGKTRLVAALVHSVAGAMLDDKILALKHYDKIAPLAPYSTYAWEIKSFIARQIGDTQKYLEATTMVAKLWPTPEAYGNLVIANVNVANLAAASQVLGLIEKMPESPVSVFPPPIDIGLYRRLLLSAQRSPEGSDLTNALKNVSFLSYLRRLNDIPTVTSRMDREYAEMEKRGTLAGTSITDTSVPNQFEFDFFYYRPKSLDSRFFEALKKIAVQAASKGYKQVSIDRAILLVKTYHYGSRVEEQRIARVYFTGHVSDQSASSDWRAIKLADLSPS